MVNLEFPKESCGEQRAVIGAGMGPDPGIHMGIRAEQINPPSFRCMCKERFDLQIKRTQSQAFKQTAIALYPMNPGKDGPSWSRSRVMQTGALALSFLNCSSPGLLPGGPQTADAPPSISVTSAPKEER